MGIATRAREHVLLRGQRGQPTAATLDNKPAARTSGAGIYLWVPDIDGNGWDDIAARAKERLYLLSNLGP